jgi:hypothetical protein
LWSRYSWCIWDNDRKGFIIARGKQKQSKKIYGYVASAVHYGLLALALLIASQFGIKATSILALFGAVGFGLGLALQEHSPIYLLLWLFAGRASISWRYTIRGHGVWKGHAIWNERSKRMMESWYMYQIEHEYHGSHKHESKRYYTGVSGSTSTKNADISKSISVVKMQYTPHQAYASKTNQGMDQ